MSGIVSSVAVPKRIQLRRTRGWRKPPGAIVVARPSRWGNPFQVVHERGRQPDDWCVKGADGCRYTGFTSQANATAWAVDRFRLAIDFDRQYGGNRLRFCYADLGLLRGYDLGCWCDLDQPCHADHLLDLANA